MSRYMGAWKYMLENLLDWYPYIVQYDGDGRECFTYHIGNLWIVTDGETVYVTGCGVCKEFSLDSIV